MQKRVVILGAGESGTGAALLAKAKGFDVFVSDAGSISPHFKAELTQAHIPFEENTHTLEMILNADEIIKSPGIPDHVPVMKEINQRRLPVINELEFAWRFAKGRFILITGTNGKTTTTLLTHHLLKEAGKDVGLAGNVGYSLARMLTRQKHKLYVLEVSNFQLEGMYEFKANTAILLNITPDHLDRYYNHFQSYVNAKFRITQNMTENDNLIVFQDDQVIAKELIFKGEEINTLRISLLNEVRHGAYNKDGLLHFTIDSNEIFSIPESEIPIRGPHNLVNAMAAISAAQIEGLSKEEILKGLRSFSNAPHRLELVTEVNGVKYYNDSKATNVESTYFALMSFIEPIVWIAGGKDKGNDYNRLLPLVKEKVKALVCLGADNKKLIEFFGPHLPVINTHSVEDALRNCRQLAKQGDVVLLSPACSSFDLFKNYEDRGEQFKRAAKALHGNDLSTSSTGNQ
jgi:UDP-N-acetylmuramoylalanine--D-glutamate ligase